MQTFKPALVFTLLIAEILAGMPIARADNRDQPIATRRPTVRPQVQANRPQESAAPMGINPDLPYMMFNFVSGQSRTPLILSSAGCAIRTQRRREHNSEPLRITPTVGAPHFILPVHLDAGLIEEREVAIQTQVRLQDQVSAPVEAVLRVSAVASGQEVNRLALEQRCREGANRMGMAIDQDSQIVLKDIETTTLDPQSALVSSLFSEIRQDPSYQEMAERVRDLQPGSRSEDGLIRLTTADRATQARLSGVRPHRINWMRGAWRILGGIAVIAAGAYARALLGGQYNNLLRDIGCGETGDSRGRGPCAVFLTAAIPALALGLTTGRWRESAALSATSVFGYRMHGNSEYLHAGADDETALHQTLMGTGLGAMITLPSALYLRDHGFNYKRTALSGAFTGLMYVFQGFLGRQHPEYIGLAEYLLGGALWGAIYTDMVTTRNPPPTRTVDITEGYTNFTNDFKFRISTLQPQH